MGGRALSWFSRRVPQLGWAFSSARPAVVVVLVGVFGLPLLSLSCAREHPSDQALREKFLAHRSEFDQLLAMAKSDSVGRIAPEFFDPSTGVADERWNQYRSLFLKLGLERGITIASDRVVLIASAEGMFSAGSSKGYVYSATKLEPLVQSLDEIPDGSESNVPTYAPLAVNWYLFLQWGD